MIGSDLVPSDTRGTSMSKLVKVKIGTAVKRYLETDKIQQLEPATLYNYDRCLGYLLKATGSQINTQDLRATHIHATLNLLRETRSEKSLNNDRTILGKFVSYLHGNDMLSRYKDPMADIEHYRRPPAAKPLHSMILTPDQFGACLAAATNYHPRERAMLALGCYACMRESEMLDLRWGDVEGVDGVMQFYRRKQNTWLRLPKFQALENELNMWKVHYRNLTGEANIDPDWYVLPGRLKSRGGPQFGMNIDPTWPILPTRRVGELSRPCHTVYGLAGLDHENWGVHTLRRTGACMWLKHSKNMRTVQKILGHSSITTTEIYVQYVDGWDDLVEAAETFDPLGMADMAIPLPAPVARTGESSNVVAFRRRPAV